MKWLTDLLGSVANTGLWVFAVYKISRYAIDKFEASIGRSVDRLRRLGSVEFDPTPNKELPQDEASPFGETRALPAPATSLQERKLEEIRAWVQQFPEAEREERLQSALAAWQIYWHFEFVHANILGSQLSLLKSLNSQPIAVDHVRAGYDRFAVGNTQLYSNYPYERWLTWLRDAARCVDESEGLMSITEEGRSFLNYLVTRGYSLEKPG